MTRHLLLTFSLSTLGVAILSAQIQHGTIEVDSGFIGPTSTPFPAAPVFKSDTSNDVSFSTRGDTNKGDYALEFGPSLLDDDTSNGVLISSVSNNGRNGDNGDFATAHVETNDVSSYYYIPVFKAGVSEAEINMDVSFGFFPHSEFLGGRLENTSNNGALNRFYPLSIASFITRFITQDTGETTLNFNNTIPPGSSLPASSDNGILLVSGAKNEANYALSRANTDGSFTIFCHDNNANQDTYENDPVAFVYLPFDSTDQSIVAMGRVSGIAEGATVTTGADDTRGNFTLTKGTTGIWYLEVDGHSAADATLLVSPEGGGSFNIDNIISSEWDAANSRWEIQSRDLTSTDRQDVDNTIAEPSFSFAVIVNLARTVLNTNDSGPGSLRYAIDNAQDGWTISFAEGLNGETITLDSELTESSG